MGQSVRFRSPYGAPHTPRVNNRDTMNDLPADLTTTSAAARELLTRRQAPDAIAILEPALERHPDSSELWELAAAAYFAVGRGKRAMTCLERLTTLAPQHVAAWMGLGGIRARLGLWGAAVEAFRRAGRLAPSNVQPLLALAEALTQMDKPAEATAAYRQVLKLEPAHPVALGKVREAVAAMETLLQLAFTADQMNAYGEARENYEAVLLQDPHSVLALSRLLSMDGVEGRLAEADLHHRRLAEALDAVDLAAVHPTNLAIAAYQSIMRPLPRATYAAVCEALDRQMIARAAQLGPLPSPPPKTGTRLRIGYLSNFLRDHPIGHVTAGLFAAHDRAKVEVHVFYLPDGGPNPYTDQIRRGAEHFHTAADAAEMARTIAQENLDLLIYLDGYMSPSLLEVIARRPAPLQVYWLGHAGGCEMSAIDAMIADEIVIPPGEEHLTRARVVRLPGPYHPASPHAIGPAMTRTEAGLPETGFVFCAFNNPDKIDTPTFDLWMRILARVEGSVLWLSRTQGQAIETNLRAAAETRGIDGARLVFAQRLADKAAHLARHRCAGLFLDTLGLNASTTALDALWAGLPLLTVTGDRFAARIATTFLTTLDLPELICRTPAEFEARAVELATRPEALAHSRERLASNVTHRPLFQIETFCRTLEAALTAFHAERLR